MFYSIAHELIFCNWESDEVSIAASCIGSIIIVDKRMGCDIIINVPSSIDLCSKYYTSSYDSIILSGIHRHFINNTITPLIIDVFIHFVTDSNLILVYDPASTVHRTLINELQATQDYFNKELLHYLEVTLFDRLNNASIL